MPPQAPPKPETATGTVALEVVRQGTASEHEAVVLKAPGKQRLILQRIGGNAFSDARTRRLVGHRVRVTGYRLGSILRYETVELLDP